ncbi:MAG: hypothetical protein IPG23_00960 [Burkholderiales bacterium]|nr:hypothetical protein [Burkholderiales bacterium]
MTASFVAFYFLEMRHVFMCGLRMLAAKQSSGSHLKWFCPTIGANTLAAEISRGFGRSGLKGSANTQARATTRVQIDASLLSANELTGCHANI